MDATTQRLCDFTRNLRYEDMQATALAGARQNLIALVDELERQPELTQLIETTRLRAPDT